MIKPIPIVATLLFIITSFSSPKNTDIKANPQPIVDNSFNIELNKIDVDSPILTDETKKEIDEVYKKIDRKIQKAQKESNKLKNHTEITKKQAKVIENLIIKDSIKAENTIYQDSIINSQKNDNWFNKFLKKIKLKK